LDWVEWIICCIGVHVYVRVSYTIYTYYTVTDPLHVGCQKFQLNEKDIYFSFLPLAHIFDRVSEEFYVYIGASIGFWQGVSLIVPPY
jgi:long-subunit acyl-CoA synthetase (AMP-forming)